MYYNSRLIRWSLFLQQFSYEIIYCRGKDNIVADFFSRNSESKFRSQKYNNLLIADLNKFCLPQRESESSSLAIMVLHNDDGPLKQVLKNLAYKQNGDSKIKYIIEKIESNNPVKNFEIYKNILFHKNEKEDNWCIVIPEGLKRELIVIIHERLGHPGVYKTLMFLKLYYYWKGMCKDVKKRVLSCDLCQRVKNLTIAMEGEMQLVRSEMPGDLVTVDFYGPLPRARGGVQYVFVVLDAFSKLVRLYTMKKATTQSSLKAIFEKYIPECGKPKRILADNGTQFTAKKWREKLESEGILVIFSSIRHPQSNPTERVMRELGRMFRTFCVQKHTAWAVYIEKIQHLLNITTHYSTALTPYELHFGKPITDIVEKVIKFPTTRQIDHNFIIALAKENIENNFRKRRRGRKVSTVELNVGDAVLLRVRHLSNALDHVTKKFFNLYEGPYVINKIIGINAFELKDPQKVNQIIGTYNRANLRKYVYSD